MKAIQLQLQFQSKSPKQLDFHCIDGYMVAYGEDAEKVSFTLNESLGYENGVPVVRFNLLKRADIVLPKLVRAGYFIKMMGV